MIETSEFVKRWNQEVQALDSNPGDSVRGGFPKARQAPAHSRANAACSLSMRIDRAAFSEETFWRQEMTELRSRTRG